MEPLKPTATVRFVTLSGAARAVADVFAGDGSSAELRRFDAPVPTAAAAASALDCEVGAIANSLVFTVEGRPVLIIASGAHRVDTARIAQHFQVAHRQVKRASAATVLAATGQEVGGVAPVGHPTALPTIIDAALAEFDQLWAGGGDHHTMVATTYARLVALTSATPLDLAT